ncbi:hypothetical protein NM208_g17026 [Fusarium decemcellulare]|uniref:Uncharacterized protein n=1 Tax=Fusarium decemcellulare TaxID=57161 RepID=A0ACC1RBX6_9HYPO|nr:hypothetical protein NM208_g17026 [Fusarium decemcellulare]
MLRGDVKEGQDGWVEDVDVDEMIAHIRRGQTYDGGVAESSRHESHAGYAYCAIGALSLLDRPLDSSSSPSDKALKEGIPDREGLLQFLASRQFVYLPKEEEEDDVEENFIESKVGEDNYGHVGFNGRWNKKADTCYYWWVGGTLAGERWPVGEYQRGEKRLGRRWLLVKLPAKAAGGGVPGMGLTTLSLSLMRKTTSQVSIVNLVP